MGKLIYLMTTSLDGYATDENGNFDWAMPTEEVHAYVDQCLQNVGTILMGRNLYDTMKIWEEIPTEGVGGPMDGPSQAMNDYAKIWHTADKIVYSTTLADVDIANTTIERSFDPTEVQKLVTASDKDYDIGGMQLATEAIKANIIDEYHQIVAPVVIGAGKHWLPQDVKLELELIDVHQFENGFVHLAYRKK